MASSLFSCILPSLPRKWKMRSLISAVRNSACWTWKHKICQCFASFIPAIRQGLLLPFLFIACWSDRYTDNSRICFFRDSWRTFFPAKECFEFDERKRPDWNFKQFFFSKDCCVVSPGLISCLKCFANESLPAPKVAYNSVFLSGSLVQLRFFRQMTLFFKVSQCHLSP